MTTTTYPIHEATRPFTEPEGDYLRARDAERNGRIILTDAEEEEIAELWASDRGNQGA